MEDDVRVTVRGKNAIDKMKRVIDGDLLNNIQTLAQEGNTLSEPGVWQGKAANRFRGEWPEIEGNLRRIREQLLELQTRINNTHINIFGVDNQR